MSIVPVNLATLEVLVDIIADVTKRPLTQGEYHEVVRRFKSVSTHQFCRGTTKQGRSCRRVVRGDYCHLHDPSTAIYCSGKTKNGSQCRRVVKAEGSYCYQHKGQAEEVTETVVTSPHVQATKEQYKRERDEQYIERFNDVDIMRSVMQTLVESKFEQTYKFLRAYPDSQPALVLYKKVWNCGIEVYHKIVKTNKIDRKLLCKFEDLVDEFDAIYGDKYTSIPYLSLMERIYYS